MSERDFVMDQGNSAVKAKSGSGREVVLPHHLTEISERDYQKIERLERGEMPVDYLRINGKPYVVGEKALTFDPTLEPLMGNARYTKEYAGTLAAATLAHAYKVGGDVNVFASYPPGDVDFRDQLMDAIYGEYEVVARGKTLRFNVVYCQSFEEPEGGYNNVLLADDGLRLQDPEIVKGETLVIDIGYWTADLMGINKDQTLNYGVHDSYPLGMAHVERSLENQILKAYPDLKSGTVKLPRHLIRQALASEEGVLYAGGNGYPVHDELQYSKNDLIAGVKSMLNSIDGGLVRFHTVIITGGGGAFLFNDLLRIMNHGRVFLAEVGEYAHLANVRGGLKLWKMLDAAGVL